MRAVRLATVAVVGLVIFGLGVKVGAILGWHQFLLNDGAAKALLLTGELRVLRAGDARKLIPTKEIELDGEIVKALTFRESGFPMLLWPFDGAPEHERYLRSVAQYRAEYPSAIPHLPVQQDTPMTTEMKTYAEEVRARTVELMRDFSQ